ncbi:hypothetical protein PENANT_c041G08133 [Penicillium antarcticum]|uniref:Transcription factor domain-containing protein n=1 Tax=Penicillium antarcticum TaxID=416450 RepID=A0A1V6PSE2_9EURO|nr:hypothetical protein PENANT_c041G08133 [Penicillium antarcticum]
MPHAAMEFGSSGTKSRWLEGLSRRPEQMQDRDRTWVCLNTTMTGLEIHFDGKQNAKVETVSRSGSLSPCLSTIPSGGRADCDPALMSYFEHIICSSSTLVDNAHCNPYRYLILPMALKSEGLYHAALAIAANTLKLSDTTYRLPALEHHHRALAHLRGLLTKNDWCESEIYEMLGLVLMLCWFDISDSSRPSWVTHLTGFQNLIRTRKECPGPSYHSQELTSFLNRYFAFHLVLARTAFRVTSTSQAPPILPNTILEASDIIDPYVGFSPALLLMIDQVAELAWTQDGPDEISRKGVYQLKANLDNLPQRLPAEHIDPTTECVAIAEANRLGALFFLYEICSTKSASSKSPILSLA